MKWKGIFCLYVRRDAKTGAWDASFEPSRSMCRGSHSGNRRACSGYCWWSSSSTLPGWPQRPVNTNYIQTFSLSLLYVLAVSVSDVVIYVGGWLDSVGWCLLKTWERGELITAVLLYTTACLWLNFAVLLSFLFFFFSFFFFNENQDCL